ncbi:MAG: Gfo/Idh/MocA family oxidoreductase [Geminicoccaceae bacterium]|nr:Gfo/Idh/MocA family oxidoreductase [Geminicoccaceae bacterium]HRY22996.1 Gfo/Idh/MocA family oxidoreductase [Geminicoccaceae bacterium]
MADPSPLRIGMIGHGMMGVWHSQNLDDLAAVKGTIVGRRQEPTEAFAAEHGYARATTDLDSMLADPAIDAVVVASPSEAHVEHCLAVLAAGKHVLLEIPIALDLAGAERVAAAAAASDRVVAVCHPWRHRPEFIALRERLAAGEEKLGMIEGRFLIHRLENVGATGYRRSWTDNILWHHGAHLIDLACWLMGEVDEVTGYMAPVDPRTGIPMTTAINMAQKDGTSAHLLLTYLSQLKHNEAMALTDRDSYRIDVPRHELLTASGTLKIDAEPDLCRRVIEDFVDACRHGRRPRATPADVMPAMRAMQVVQDAWDARHGVQSLPGRDLARLGQGR